MSINLSPNECGVETFNGVNVLAFSIGVDLEVSSSSTFVMEKGDGIDIAYVNSDGDRIFQDYIYCSNCYNVGEYHDFDNKTIEYDTSFSDDTIAIVGSDSGATPTPRGWPEVARNPEPSDFEASMSVDVNAQSQYCPGSTAEIDVTVTNTSFCSALKNTSITVTNNLNGDSKSVTLTEPSSADSGTVRWTRDPTETFQFDIPSDSPLVSNEPIFDVSVTSNAVNSPVNKSINGSIGSVVSNLSLQSIPDIEGVCDGESVNPDITAVNVGNCEENLGLRIVRDDDVVLSKDPTTVSTGDADPGQHSYRTRFEASK